MNHYLLLMVAIISEVFASSMLKASAGFKKLLPSLGVVVGYVAAFYALSKTLQTLPIGVAYAIWAGLGTALTAIVGMLFYKEKMNATKFAGIILIIGGVMVLNLSGAH